MINKCFSKKLMIGVSFYVLIFSLYVFATGGSISRDTGSQLAGAIVDYCAEERGWPHARTHVLDVTRIDENMISCVVEVQPLPDGDVSRMHFRYNEITGEISEVSQTHR